MHQWLDVDEFANAQLAVCLSAWAGAVREVLDDGTNSWEFAVVDGTFGDNPASQHRDVDGDVPRKDSHA